MSDQGKDFDVLVKLGERAIELHEDDKAISYFEQAIKLNKKSSIPFCHIGNIYVTMGKLDKAKKYYEKALKIDPNYDPLYYYLGFVYFGKGDISKAIRYLEKAIVLLPDFYLSYFYLGQAYFEKNDLEKAVLCLEKALEISPEEEEIHYTLGFMYNVQGKGEQAISSFGKAIELNPRNFEALLSLSSVFVRQYDLYQATKYYEQLIAQNPKDEVILKSLAELKAVLDELAPIKDKEENKFFVELLEFLKQCSEFKIMRRYPYIWYKYNQFEGIHISGVSITGSEHSFGGAPDNILVNLLQLILQFEDDKNLRDKTQMLLKEFPKFRKVEEDLEEGMKIFYRLPKKIFK